MSGRASCKPVGKLPMEKSHDLCNQSRGNLVTKLKVYKFWGQAALAFREHRANLMQVRQDGSP